GIHLGSDVADDRRCHIEDDPVALVTKKTPGLLTRRIAFEFAKTYFSAATPACETVSSCEPVPPLTPIAPIILPPTTSGRAMQCRRRALADRRRRGPCRADARKPPSDADNAPRCALCAARS